MKVRRYEHETSRMSPRAVRRRSRCLRYFAGLLEEVCTESFPPSYWRHVEFNLRRCERLWRNRPVEGTGSARPDLEQASPPSNSREASSGTAVGDPEETG